MLLKDYALCDNPCFPSVMVIDPSGKTYFLLIDAPCKGNIMKQLLAALFAAMFALGTVAVFAADAAKKDEPKKEAKKDEKKDEKKAH